VEESEIVRLRTLSGDVITSDKLVSFLYQLMSDHLSTGVVQKLVDTQKASVDNVDVFTNGYLAEYAKYLAERLKN